MSWLRRWWRQEPQPLRWSISTPYSTMRGEGDLPVETIRDLKAQGIKVEVTLENIKTGSQNVRVGPGAL